MGKKKAVVEDWDWEEEFDSIIENSDPLRPWVQFLGLQIFVRRGRQFGSHWWVLRDAEVDDLLDLSEEQTRWSLRRKLQHARKLLAELPHPVVGDEAIFENLEQVGERLGFGEVELKILFLAALRDLDPIIEAMLEETHEWSLDRLASLLSAVLELKTKAVHQALLPNSLLRSSGLLVDLQRRDLSLLPGFAAQLLQRHNNASDLFDPLFQTAKPSTLSLEDFPHLQAHSDLLTRLLQGAWREQRSGIHILLHGAPGTGKTEYARALAKAVDAQLVEVRSQDTEQQPIEGDERFQAYALCQRTMARQPRSLVLFDEVEDVFFDWAPWAPRISRHKGWTNRLLEEAPVPTIWISNRVDGIDAAYRRRMIYELSFRLPPKEIRRRILQHHWEAQSLPAASLPESVLEAELQPREIRQLATALQLVAPSAGDRPKVIQQMLRQSGHRVPVQSPIGFDLQLIECDQDLGALVDDLEHLDDARLLLQGPSGTGKTAFVRHLGDRLQRDLHVKTASDLLSKYLGETEERIAEAFAEAEGGILFLDEADSFLSPRESAHHSWEVSMVNELLQRMESFAGVLIMATNLRDRLDSAVFRRFDWEIRFAPMGLQKRILLLQKLQTLGWLEGQDEILRELARELEGLVPADLAILQRRYRNRGIPPQDQLLAEIHQQIRMRTQNSGRAIGFTAQSLGNVH